MTTATPVRRLVLVPAPAASAARRPAVRRLLLARSADIMGPELLPVPPAAQDAPARGVRAP